MNFLYHSIQIFILIHDSFDTANKLLWQKNRMTIVGNWQTSLLQTNKAFLKQQYKKWRINNEVIQFVIFDIAVCLQT